MEKAWTEILEEAGKVVIVALVGYFAGEVTKEFMPKQPPVQQKQLNAFNAKVRSVR